MCIRDSLRARLGALLAECRASNVFLDALNEFSFASEAELLAQACAVLPLCEYTFDRYRTEKDPRVEHTVSVLADGALAPVLAEGASLAGAVMTARDLVNDIAETLTPAELCLLYTSMGTPKRYISIIWSLSICSPMRTARPMMPWCSATQS